MTDITSAPSGVWSNRLPNPTVSLLVIARAAGGPFRACGRGLADLSLAYARALERAYVSPGRASEQGQRPVSDTDGEGRDPRW
jgi:hypothetical protein